ncbi:MAG: hypothetical protein LBF12_04435 [Christensenellaceae bacterium]|nr:hypothetical protein [Christensenellaceae bacterium]
MNRELKRIYINKGTLAILILTIVVIFLLATILNYGSYKKTSINYDQYSSIDELTERIEEFNTQIKQYESEEQIYSNIIADLKLQIRITEFLIENKISYEYLSNNIADSSMDLYATDIADHIFTFGFISFFCLLLCLLASSIITINLDFTTGIARLLYALDRERKKILNQKYFAYIASIGIFALIFSVIIAIIGSPYKSNFSQVLIVESSRIYLMNTGTYIFIFLCSQFLMILFFSIVVFSISMLIRGVYGAAFVNIMFLSSYLLLTNFSTSWLSAFFSEIISFNTLTVPIYVFIILYLLRNALAILLFIFARKRFLKRSIY